MILFKCEICNVEFKGALPMDVFTTICRVLSFKNQKKNIKIKKIIPKTPTPKYQTSGASGFDLCSMETITILPGETHLIRTGLCFQIPEGLELQIRPRSGLSYKTGLRIANSPGTVDSDFLGEVKIIATNTGSEPFHIVKLDRIAQGVICPVIKVEFTETDEFIQTQRGEGAFGSTGK